MEALVASFQVGLAVFKEGYLPLTVVVSTEQVALEVSLGLLLVYLQVKETVSDPKEIAAVSPQD